MARKIETRVFEGVEITAQQHPALECLSLVPRLGSHLAGLLAAMEGGEISGASDVKALAPYLQELFKTLTPLEIKSIAVELFRFSYAIIDGKKVDLIGQQKIDRAFEDVSLMGLANALVWVAGLNLGFTVELPGESGTGS